jgi:hypothetical protein
MPGCAPPHGALRHAKVAASMSWPRGVKRPDSRTMPRSEIPPVLYRLVARGVTISAHGPRQPGRGTTAPLRAQPARRACVGLLAVGLARVALLSGSQVEQLVAAQGRGAVAIARQRIVGLAVTVRVAGVARFAGRGVGQTVTAQGQTATPSADEDSAMVASIEYCPRRTTYPPVPGISARSSSRRASGSMDASAQEPRNNASSATRVCIWMHDGGILCLRSRVPHLQHVRHLSLKERLNSTDRRVERRAGLVP